MRKYPRCNLCDRDFHSDFYLKRHVEGVHKDQEKHNVLKVDDEYKCKMCGKCFADKNHFKKHIYLYHSDIEVKAKYNRTLEFFIGEWSLKRIR